MTLQMPGLSGVSGRMEAAPGVLEALDRGLTQPNQASDWRATVNGTRMNGKRLAEFEAKYVVTDAGCWEWTAAKNRQGYGLFPFRGQTLAHRVSYIHFTGPIPADLELDHLCRNPACVKPDHLEAVTHRENVLRSSGITARAHAATHCPRGHEYTADNTYQDPAGARRCRTCKKASDSQKTHCRDCGAALYQQNVARHRRSFHNA